VVSGEAVYYGGQVWGGGYDPKVPESKIRTWGLDRVLSGDTITEQFIHALDVATWIIDAAPIRAYGGCGKNGRDDAGTCNDHFNVTFSFPADVLLSFTGTQFGTGYSDIGCRMFGSQGMADLHYFGIAHLVGKKSYKGGKHGNLFTDGAVSNIATFHQAIANGDYANLTVPPSVRSNLTTILGRTAAYRKAEVTWDEMLQAGEKLDYSFTGLKT
jgi:predicted dehydrogenase